MSQNRSKRYSHVLHSSVGPIVSQYHMLHAGCCSEKALLIAFGFPNTWCLHNTHHTRTHTHTHTHTHTRTQTHTHMHTYTHMHTCTHTHTHAHNMCTHAHSHTHTHTHRGHCNPNYCHGWWSTEAEMFLTPMEWLTLSEVPTVESDHEVKASQVLHSSTCWSYHFPIPYVACRQLFWENAALSSWSFQSPVRLNGPTVGLALLSF